MAKQSSVFLRQLDMKKILTFLLLVSLGGCDLPNTVVTGPGAPPTISNASLSPTIINVNNVNPQSLSVIDTLVQCFVTADGIDNSTEISVSLLAPDGTLMDSEPLHDDGIFPDSKARDGVFSAQVHLQVSKSALGQYATQFIAVNGSGFRSSTIVRSVAVINSNNHAPTISNPVVPDTVTVPSSTDTTFVVVSVKVDDQDGLSDIASVTFSSRRPDSSLVGVYPLYDDGGANPRIPFGLKSGDAVAGDGIYTLTLPLTSSSDHNTYRDFTFLATDLSGETSEPLTRRIYIR